QMRMAGMRLKVHPDVFREMPALALADPRRRAWKLSEKQAGALADLFSRAAAESAESATASALAASGWVYLIMSIVQRWGGAGRSAAKRRCRAEALSLWERFNEMGLHAVDPDRQRLKDS